MEHCLKSNLPAYVRNSQLLVVHWNDELSDDTINGPIRSSILYYTPNVMLFTLLYIKNDKLRIVPFDMINKVFRDFRIVAR
jgi:hypothetical protein